MHSLSLLPGPGILTIPGRSFKPFLPAGIQALFSWECKYIVSLPFLNMILLYMISFYTLEGTWNFLTTALTKEELLHNISIELSWKDGGRLLGGAVIF